MKAPHTLNVLNCFKVLWNNNKLIKTPQALWHLHRQLTNIENTAQSKEGTGTDEELCHFDFFLSKIAYEGHTVTSKRGDFFSVLNLMCLISLFFFILNLQTSMGSYENVSNFTHLSEREF